MDMNQYKQRLLELETRLSARAAREREGARGQVLDTPGDMGDASVADEGQSEDFAEGELDATVLQQVRDALKRIDSGTYGRCVVDGRPIEPKRLEAAPWTPYCLKHQTQVEQDAQQKTPTL